MGTVSLSDDYNLAYQRGGAVYADQGGGRMQGLFPGEYGHGTY